MIIKSNTQTRSSGVSRSGAMILSTGLVLGALFLCVGSEALAEEETEFPCEEMVGHAVDALAELGVTDPPVDRMMEACLELHRFAPPEDIGTDATSI